MALTLRWKATTRLPVDGSALRPDAMAGLGATGVARRPVLVGNRPAELGELFEVSGDAADRRVVVEGDVRPVRRLGAGMAGGTLVIEGDAGPYLGAEMLGGEVDLRGDAGDLAGAGMRGGLLRIRGAAGDGLGAAMPGARLGMRDGIILAGGPAGDDAALAMRRGLIAVFGPVGSGFGRGMIAGSAFAFGAVGRFAGAGMKRGTLAMFGDGSFEPLPTFHPAGPQSPPFLALYLRALRDLGAPVPAEASLARFQRYNGDLATRGQGEILIRIG